MDLSEQQNDEVQLNQPVDDVQLNQPVDEVQLNQQVDEYQFPLFTQKNIEELYRNPEVRIRQDKKIQTLNHQCDYKWINEELPEFAENKIRLLVITWNMLGNLPGFSLQKLFRVRDIKHHLIVIGTQECSKSIALSIFCESKSSWEEKLQLELGKEYVKLNSVSLNAMHLIAFANVQLMTMLKIGKTMILPRGFMNVVGNKGGISLELMIGGKTFFFINSHLESGQNNQKNREKQFEEISLTLEQQQIKLKKYDYMIWVGDFNSRINLNITEENVTKQKFYECLINDQMYCNRHQSKGGSQNNTTFKSYLVFQGDFLEGLVSFPPTYKLSSKSNQYGSGKSYRIPGWTDRIIFKEFVRSKSFHTMVTKGMQIIPETTHTTKQSSLILHNYDSNFDILGSDHRPVYGQFTALI